jgi:small subunit ribosomal protein S19
MTRSVKKGPYIDPRLLEKMEKLGKSAPIRTWSRSSVISPEMVGHTFEVHNGRSFLPVKITEEMIGFRLGEFALTRKFTRHGGKMQRELEAAGKEEGKSSAAAGVPAAPAAQAPEKQKSNKPL